MSDFTNTILLRHDGVVNNLTMTIDPVGTILKPIIGDTVYLPIATTSNLGIIQVGDTLEITGSGVLDVNDRYITDIETALNNANAVIGIAQSAETKATTALSNSEIALEESNGIIVETNRAILAETNLQDQITQAYGSVIKIDGSLVREWIPDYNDLINKTDTSVFVRNDLTTAQQLSGDLNTLGVLKQNGSNVALANDLSTEVTARENVDTILQTNINNEVTTRSSGDSTLQTNINNEITNRTNADVTLQTNIESETTARINADALKANDSDVVHLTGDQKIAGFKSFDNSQKMLNGRSIHFNPLTGASGTYTDNSLSGTVSGLMLLGYTSPSSFASWNLTELAQNAEQIVSKSLTTNGYIKYASGILIQWGIMNLPTGSNDQSYQLTFPIAFSNILYKIVTMQEQVGYDPAGNYRNAQSVTNKTVASCYIYRGGSQEIKVDWIAIGV